MGYSNGIISAPVSINDVQCVLVTTENDLGQLCMHKNVNIWSARKPIYHTKVTQLTTEDWQGMSRTLQGYKTGGGIKKRAYTWSEYKSGMNNGSPASQVWEHDKPVADGQCAFRLTDFEGYYQRVDRTFKIYQLFGNISSIPMPSTDTTGSGPVIEFTFGFTTPTPDGGIMPLYLFGDCADYYPAVILTCALTGSRDYQYVKAAEHTLSYYYPTSNTSTIISVRIDTYEFARFIRSHYDVPYNSAPLSDGSMWTGTVVLLKYPPTLNVVPTSSETDIIVRLEYATGVDRKTLPVKQNKHNNIEWMKMTVIIKKVVGYQRKYKLDSISVTAKMLTTASVTFYVSGSFSTPQGTVVCNTTSGQSISVDNFSIVNFSGTVGEVTKNLTFAETTWDVTATTAGNQLVNGNLAFSNSNGVFQEGFSFDVSNQYPEYAKADIKLL